MATRLTQHLVARGLVSTPAADAALTRQREQGGAIDTALLESDAVGELTLVQVMGEVSEAKPINLADFEPNPEMARRVPANVAQRLGVVPLSMEGRVLHLACAYPPPLRDLQNLSAVLGAELEVWVALEVRIREWISAVYGAPLPPRFASLLARIDPDAQRGGSVPVEEHTLEEALSLDAVERIAQSVAEEPILLEKRKDRPAPEPSGVVEWTLEEARAALAGAAHDRDKIVEVALLFARRTFDFVAAFTVSGGTAAGWAADGEGAQPFRENPPSIPLDAPSLFRTVSMTRASYFGPMPQDAHTDGFLGQMGRSPRTLFLHPVEVKGRVVCLLYGDSGARASSQRRVNELRLFCQELPAAFEELILFKKRQGAPGPAARPFEPPAPPPPPPPAALTAEEKPASGLETMLRRLTGPDARDRLAAVAELARSPDASARALVAQFPGPTAWARIPVSELPEPEELGPIPAALTRLGRPGAQALAPLLDAEDGDVRYFALLTAGSMPFPELAGGVLRGLFDPEPDVSSAARAAAPSFRRVQRFLTAMRDLRQELAAKDPLRAALAARALGVLHDRESMEGLINLTGSDDALCADAAAEALRAITRASFGTDPRRWSAWWAENRGRRRAEWLVRALRHPDPELRLGAIEELSRALNDSLGYAFDAPAHEREQAVRRWEAALGDPQLARVE